MNSFFNKAGERGGAGGGKIPGARSTQRGPEIGLGGLPVFRGFFGFIFKPVFSV
jgi:hypothetical protein